MFAKSGLLAATALTGVLGASLVAAPARAQDANAQINSIERQIHGLQSQLSSMKHSLIKRDAEVRAAREEAAAANRQALAISQRTTNGFGQPLPPQSLAAPPGYQVNLGAPGTIPKYGPYVYVGGVPTPVLYPGPPLKHGQFEVGGIRVTLGGFIAAESVARSRNETQDIGSNFNNSLPYANSPNYHTPEFHETGRQSRLSILAEGNPDDVTTLSAYYEMDFLGSGSGSNSVESNSYVLRERQLYTTYARKDWDFYVSGGQMWSLLTMNKVGITQRKEDAPLTIDAQYVPGFVWTRQAGLRFVKGFDNDLVDVGLSFENPQASYFTGGSGTGSLSGTVLSNNTGGGTYNPDTTYSDDVAPDVIGKVTADPGWGHYEAFGIARFLHDRTTQAYPGNNGRNNTVLAGGGGAGAILPLIKGKLDLQGSALIGEGIGRYGSAQLPDATFSQNGAPVPLPEVIALVGLVGHPIKTIDLYGYVGTEQITQSKAFNEAGMHYGYGNEAYSNAGCNIEQPVTSPLVSPCTANTSGIVQGTVGAWWRFLQGDFGIMQTGVQYSYTRKNAFQGVGGAPKTDDNMLFLSFRYYPFD